ncbi:tyrosine--tRNA ligase [Patescibacteria group bacterium]|nr:tyrosine--tRNA ligase [Patescibacteria group bacterium]
MDKINEVLTRGVVDIVEKDSLRKRMLRGEKLRIKLGIDPTGPNIHIGRGSTLKKLREFQELGHQIVLIIGDGTAVIGDASDKTTLRPMLTPEQISENERNYLNQIGRVINLQETEIHHNSEWINKLTPPEWIKLAGIFTVQQIIERENFAERIKKGDPVGLHETLYPLLQGWDSVNISADLEIGGTDQLFNLLAGRKIQEQFGQKPQDIMTLQLLAGTDGRKMSTSWGNVILIIDSPEEKYGKIMRISDQLIPVYMEIATDIPIERVEKIKKLLEEGEGNPMDYKKELAFNLVKLYDGEEAATTAQDHFEKIVQEKELPEVIPTFTTEKTIKIDDLVTLMIRSNIVKSKSEAKRLIKQGGVKIEDKKIELSDELTVEVPTKEEGGIIIRAGKRQFLKLIS